MFLVELKYEVNVLLLLDLLVLILFYFKNTNKKIFLNLNRLKVLDNV